MKFMLILLTAFLGVAAAAWAIEKAFIKS